MSKNFTFRITFPYFGQDSYCAAFLVSSIYTSAHDVFYTRGPSSKWQVAHQKQLLFSVGNYPLSIFSDI
jgi:hypothetical protein